MIIFEAHEDSRMTYTIEWWSVFGPFVVQIHYPDFGVLQSLYSISLDDARKQAIRVCDQWHGFYSRDTTHD